MRFKTIKLLLQLSYLLMVCHHVGVTAIGLPHDQVDDELRVIVVIKPLDPELGCDAHAIDEGVIFHHIVCHVEMQSNHVEESISLGGNQNDTLSSPNDGEGAIKVHAPLLLGHQGRRLLCFCPFRRKSLPTLGSWLPFVGHTLC
jgi:hypothetical protein